MNIVKLVTVFAIVCVSTMTAQEKNKFSFGVDLGVAANAESFGILGNLEPMYAITDKSTLGLRVGQSILLGRNTSEKSGSQFTVDNGTDATVVFSLAATYNRYFGKENSKVQPFIGGGISYNITQDEIVRFTNNDTNTSVETKVDKVNHLGFLLRGGIMLNRFKIGVEYNFLPSTDLKINSGDVIGEVNDSYFGLSVGYVFGGGKRVKN